ncbi:MAG: anaerobic ribonucleoside-triphosphate reductase [Spirochaetaceae bacterium]|nr:anaerobic ribonucleoside-triphosphate reductase [Spirochaetaceae bacterium]
MPGIAEAIERRIEELRVELGRAEGTPTEVYSRIVGYYRSVRNWNAGKRDEYAQRRAFAMPDSVETAAPHRSRARPSVMRCPRPRPSSRCGPPASPRPAAHPSRTGC